MERVRAFATRRPAGDMTCDERRLELEALERGQDFLPDRIYSTRKGELESISTTSEEGDAEGGWDDLLAGPDVIEERAIVTLEDCLLSQLDEEWTPKDVEGEDLRASPGEGKQGVAPSIGDPSESLLDSSFFSSEEYLSVDRFSVGMRVQCTATRRCGWIREIDADYTYGTRQRGRLLVQWEGEPFPETWEDPHNLRRADIDEPP